MLLETPRPALGTPAPDFTLMDAAGVVYTRDGLVGAHGLLVAFICNHCPYVIRIAPQLGDVIKTLRADGVETVLINANDYKAYPQDAPEHMPGFLAKHGIDAPYVVDETQECARAYGAVCTPDFFGYGVDLALKYRGRLEELVAGMTTGIASAAQIPSMGCSLKWR
ncbi:MAG: thioredoxin family protein [Pseudomonadota bacterium]